MNCLFSKTVVFFLLTLDSETSKLSIMNQQTNHSKKQEDLIKKRKVLYAVLGVLLVVIVLYLVYFGYSFFTDNWSENTSLALSGLFVLMTTTFLIVFMIGRINASLKK